MYVVIPAVIVAKAHDEARVHLEDRSISRIGESAVGAWAEESVVLNRHLRFVVGARADRIDVNVDDRSSGSGSGIQAANRFSPKWNC